MATSGENFVAIDSFLAEPLDHYEQSCQRRARFPAPTGVTFFEYIHAGAGLDNEDQLDPSHACTASAQLLITSSRPATVMNDCTRPAD